VLCNLAEKYIFCEYFTSDGDLRGTTLVSMVFGIEFVPKSVPLKHRLQTLSVLCYTLLFTVIPILCFLMFVGLLLSRFAIVPLAYACWIVYDVAVKRTSSRGGRRWERMRRMSIWKYMRDFFPIKLQKTVELPTDCNYVFGYHPHGIMGCGAFVNFASEATGFSEQFPGIRPHLLTLKPNFRYPFIRGILLWMGELHFVVEYVPSVLVFRADAKYAVYLYILWFITALHRMKTQSGDENSVCPSVCLSVCQMRDLLQNERKLCPHSYTT